MFFIKYIVCKYHLSFNASLKITTVGLLFFIFSEHDLASVNNYIITYYFGLFRKIVFLLFSLLLNLVLIRFFHTLPPSNKNKIFLCSNYILLPYSFYQFIMFTFTLLNLQFGKNFCLD